MKRSTTLLTCLALAGLVLSTSARSFAEENIWPSLETDHDKLQLMLWDRSVLPNFFEGMTEYEVNYFDVLEKQHQINAHLAHDPNLWHSLRYRADRVQIEFEVHSETQEKGVVAQNEIEAYLQVLRKTYQSLAEDKRNLEGINAAILSTINIMRDSSVKNLIGELINLLPKDRKKSVFPLPLEEKIQILQSEITAEDLAKLKPEKLRQLNIATPADIATTVETLLKRDQDLEDLFGLAAFFISSNGTPDFNYLSDGFMQLLGDKLETIKVLSEVLTPHNARLGAELLAKPRRLFSAAVKPRGEIHTLTEMPVTISWASSCVGGECSTKNMAAYSNIPTERRFFSDLEDGGRGFFFVQLVESYGRRMLLINMLQGGRLSPDLVVDNLIAIEQRARDLGAEGIMLPTWDHLTTHTNYNDVRTRLQAIVAGKPEVGYVYLDNPLREALRPYVNDSSYYTQNSKFKAVPVTLEDLQSWQRISSAGLHSAKPITSSTKKAPDFPFHEVKMSDGEKALVIFEVNEVAGMYDVGTRMMNGLGMSRDHYESIKHVLYNEERLPTKQYFARVAEVLKHNGYDFDITFKKNRLASLYPGLLRCPDAWAPEWQSKSIAANLTLLRRQGTVQLLIDGTHTEFGRHFDINSLPQIRNALYKDLDGKYLDRRAAAALLLAFKGDWERALPTLFGLAKESSGGDIALNEILQMAKSMDRERFASAVHSGLRDNRDWVQHGALVAIQVTGLNDPWIAENVRTLQQGQARSHDVYLHGQHIEHHLSQTCYDIVVDRN